MCNISNKISTTEDDRPPFDGLEVAKSPDNCLNDLTTQMPFFFFFFWLDESPQATEGVTGHSNNSGGERLEASGDYRKR
jgi:hypothetical protein